MRRTPEREIVLGVMDTTTTCGKISLSLPCPIHKTVDTTTWAEIIRVLEESQESERRAWFSARSGRHDFRVPQT
jgi:hypothetical protein